MVYFIGGVGWAALGLHARPPTMISPRKGSCETRFLSTKSFSHLTYSPLTVVCVNLRQVKVYSGPVFQIDGQGYTFP